MGVDLATYRGRIGTYRHACGQDVITVACVINFSRGLKTVGAVLFIGVLLLVAGIESNPGPDGALSTFIFISIVIMVIGILIQIMELKILVFYMMCLLFIGGLFWYWTTQMTHQDTKDKVSNTIGSERIPQVPHPTDPNEHQTTSKVVKISPVKSEDSNNPGYNGRQQVPASTDQALHPSVSSVGNTSCSQSESSDNSDNEENQEIPSPLVAQVHHSVSTETSNEQYKEEDNFVRMTLLILKCGMPLLRCFISHKAQELGEVIDVTLKRYERKVMRQLHRELKVIVFPENGNTDLEVWEISTLTVVLLVAFKPSLSADEKDAIQTIKSIRDNVFAHPKTLLLSAISYQRHRGDIKQAFETLLNKLATSEQDRFKTILNECENGPIGVRGPIMETIESQFQQLRADMKKTIRDECKKLVHKGKVMKECKVVETNIKIIGSKKDTPMVELVERTIVDIFNKAVKRCGASDLNSLEKAVQGILDGISDIGHAKVINAISGSIILHIEVYTNEALLGILKFIDGKSTNSMNKKLEAFTNELQKCKVLQPECSLTATVSDDTLRTLYNECNSNNLDNEDIQQVPPSTERQSVSRVGRTSFEQPESGRSSEPTIDPAMQLTGVAGEPHSPRMGTQVQTVQKQTEQQMTKSTCKVHGVQQHPPDTGDGEQQEKQQAPKLGCTTSGDDSSSSRPILQEAHVTVSPDSDHVTGIASQESVEATLQSAEEASKPVSRDVDSMTFDHVLQKLGLANKYPCKITIQDVVAVDYFEANVIKKKCMTLVDIPWMMLKRLICAHTEARDILVSDENSVENSIDSDDELSSTSESTDESEDISPLDVFIVVFQCCDPVLKQVLFQKLYLCKVAVPFLYKSWNSEEVFCPKLAVWPLRCLPIESSVMTSNNQLKCTEVDALELKTHMIAFARFGRPRYSKSKLLNSLLTNHGCKTFFNIDCPSGMTPRYLSNGHIEMFWLPKVGDNKDRFKEAMTFLNLRGDIKESFNIDLLSFLSQFIDTIAIIIDSDIFSEQAKDVKEIVLKFSSVILLITNPLKPQMKQEIKNFEKAVKVLNSDIKLKVKTSHKRGREQNVVDMVSCISAHILKQLQSVKTKSFQERLASVRNEIIKTDENDRVFQVSKDEAEQLLKQMKLDGHPRNWKQVLTPVHCNFSQSLGKLKKTRERTNDFKVGNELDGEMETIRTKQICAISKVLKQFLEILTRMSNIELKMFLCWLHFYIEREKRLVLPQLMQDSRCAWEKLKILKSEETQIKSEIDQQVSIITNLEEEIEKASFSVDHFFREAGHIYDAILTLNEDVSKLGLPPVNQIANIIGQLIANGHQLELIDGDSFFMPHKWMELILQCVDRCIGPSKIMTLSVLGVQSSGKSTLLNTMFGSQFSTRAGRCTKGIHVQLIPVKSASFKEIEITSPFDYILIVDTEGLRSPELIKSVIKSSHVQNEHDNELATVITGLGDVTMLNIMGENLGEIRDILQVVVHAFLRLKMTNRNLDTRKCCAFIHQNVPDTSASEKMISGLSKLTQTLDEMTKESARSEGIADITAFNQVIEFHISSQVWYLKHLWQGNAPMAMVNTEYSEGVVDIKFKITEKALQIKAKSYKSMNDIFAYAHSLWKGVLKEDFVFSFRNSLEIKAYTIMEKEVQDQLWHLESFIREKLLGISHFRFADCDQTQNLRVIAEKLIKELNYMLAGEKCKSEKEIKVFFENNKYKDIIIQWENNQQRRIDDVCLKLEKIIVQQIEKGLRNRSVEILTVASHGKHEEAIRKRSMEVANDHKDQFLNQEQIDKLFDDIWMSFVTIVSSTSLAQDENRKKMKTIFEDWLLATFKKNHAIVNQEFEESVFLTPIRNLNKLEGTFHLTRIDAKDITFSNWKRIRGMFTNKDKNATIEYVTGRVNKLFEATDAKIKEICKVNEEITEMAVNELLRKLDTNIHEILSGSKSYDFTIPFYVKIHVHVSRYAHAVFERHNENYFKTQGTAARLEHYKQQQKISFEAHLSNRQSEETVAKLFSLVIAGFAEEWTLQNLPNKVIDELHSILPSVKNIVIIEICSNLLKKDNFKDFMTYLETPKEYASTWIYERANNHLFAKESRAYIRIAKSLLNRIFRSVEKCVCNLRHTYMETPSPLTDSWINDFQTSLKEEQFSISPESFRIVRNEVHQIADMEYLTSQILDHLTKSQDKITIKFSQHESDSVQWTITNPIDVISKKIWGCPEQCAFCGEPCAKNKDHAGSVHYSIQHRPSCCNGISNSETNLAAITACDFDIQSNITHKCGVFDYICNKGIREDCGKRHNYREYKTYLPQWDIAPTSNMLDTSSFWMWFVATYQDDLRNYFDYRVDNIPNSWNTITKVQARESLEKTYSVS